jgi:hypothetical protein
MLVIVGYKIMLLKVLRRPVLWGHYIQMWHFSKVDDGSCESACSWTHGNNMRFIYAIHTAEYCAFFSFYLDRKH